jgi:hypothetical protein
LEKFEFFLRYCPNELIRTNSLIEFFLQQSTSVNADWIKSSNEIHFYSIPSPNHHANFISSNHDIYHLELNLKDFEFNKDHRVFPRLNSLKLFISDQCSFDCFQLLSKSIHLDNLIKIVLIICSRGEYLHLMIKNFLNFLKELPCIHSIEIFNRWHGLFTYIDINEFCSMIPRNVKHLDLDIFDINEIRILIEQLEYLSSLKLKYSFEKSFLIKDILQWLINQRMSYLSDIHYLAIWISKSIQSNKRIKIF